MKKHGRKLLVAAFAGVMLAPTATLAQQAGDPDHEWCDSSDRSNRRYERYCEVREFTIDAGRMLNVDGGPNGSIEVQGWDGDQVQVEAKVQVWSRDDDPEALARDVVIETGRRIRADVPRFGRRNREGGVSVSYRLRVPRTMDLGLETLNGSISIADVRGNIDFSATNGGIELVGLGGDVRGRTTNGGVRVELSGAEWDGRGLDVETTNGGVTLLVPEGFRADLTTGTVNGGFEIDFPVTVQGRITRRRITTELNGGGPPIRAVTTNGGVRVRRY